MSNILSNILPTIEAFPGQLLNQAKNVYNSPIGEAMTNRWGQVLPQIQSDLSNSNKQIAQGNMSQFGGLMGVDAPVESNGGKYVNEAEGDLKGGTPAKVKARPTQEIKFKYVPPQVETETTQASQPNVAQGELPPITSQVDEPSATLSSPTKPTQPKLSPRQKLIQKLNGLSNYQLSDSYGENRPALEAQDKSVMQNVIGGNTAGQILNNTEEALGKIWKKVESAAGQYTAISTNTQVLPHIKANLDDLVNKGIITQAHANNALIGEQKNLTQGGADINGNATITGNQLVDLRTGANAVNKGVPYGSTNPIPYIRQAIAKGYSDAMGNLDPQINNLYQQYGSAKRIGEMPTSFRNQNLQTLKLPVINKGVPFTGAGRRYLAAGLGGNKTAIGSAALAAGVASAPFTLPPIVNKIANDLGYVKKGSQNQGSSSEQNPSGNIKQNDSNNPANHNSTMITQVGGNSNDKGYGMPTTALPQSVGDVKLNSDGTVNPAAPSQITAGGKNIAEDPNAITSQITALQTANSSLQAAAASQNSNIAKPAQGKIAANTDKINALNNLSSKVAPVYASYQKVKTLTGATNTALQTLSGSNINIADLDSQVDNVQNSLDQKYATLKQTLAGIQGQIGSGNLNVKTQAALTAVLNKINQQNVYDYYTAINSYASPTDVGSNNSFNQQFTPQANTAPAASNTDFSNIVGGTLPTVGSNNAGLPTSQ